MSAVVMNVLKSILVEELGFAEDTISEDTWLRADLRLDSTEIVGVALELKRRLGIGIKFESREDKRLSDVCAMIDQVVAAKPSVA